MPLITAISDRMIALELGQPIVEGTPGEVTTDPRVVSSYLGGDLSAINRSGATDTTATPARRRPAGKKAAPRTSKVVPGAKVGTATRATSKATKATKATKRSQVTAAATPKAPRRPPLVAAEETVR